MNHRVWVIQDGARQHYIVPRAFQRLGMLQGVYTDWYVRPRSIEAIFARRGGQWTARQHPELDSSLVQSHAMLTLWQRIMARRYKTGEAYWEWVARSTAKWILKRGFGNASALYGFIRNVDPSVFAAARSQGIKTIGDQIVAPAQIEMAEATKMRQRYPGWGTGEAGVDLARVIEMERRTWPQLDVVLAGSDYVKQGLTQCGVSEGKIRVTRYIPVGTNLPYVDRRGRKGPLTVGFVGAVSLRKGAPYFFELARRFDPAQVKFVMIGPVQLTDEGLKHKGAVELTGAVPRERVRDWLEKFDVMLLPTTCEGRVGSVLEAMETGLPVVTTPNSGVPITEGVNGFLAQPDDIDALEARVRQLVSDEDLRIITGNRARETIQECTMDAYCRELATALD